MNELLFTRIFTREPARGLAAVIAAATLLALATPASAHHGNPDAPAPAPWSNGPAGPGLPAPDQPQAPGH